MILWNGDCSFCCAGWSGEPDDTLLGGLWGGRRNFCEGV